MFTNCPKIAAKSVRLFRVFLAFSLLIVCVLPANGFAEENTSSTPSSSKNVESETDENESTWGEAKESQSEEVPEQQAVKAENYEQAWDDAMVAAPAFDE